MALKLKVVPVHPFGWAVGWKCLVLMVWVTGLTSRTYLQGWATEGKGMGLLDPTVAEPTEFHEQTAKGPGKPEQEGT
jgi:hypothetical protein